MIRETFNTWREAAEFQRSNAKYVDSGMVLGLQDHRNGLFSVVERKIRDEARKTRDRTGEFNVVRGIISDEIQATLHPVDGKHYTSKARFRAETRAHGCVETGTERMPRTRPVKDMPDPRPYMAHLYDAMSARR